MKIAAILTTFLFLLIFIYVGAVFFTSKKAYNKIKYYFSTLNIAFSAKKTYYFPFLDIFAIYEFDARNVKAERVNIRGLRFEHEVQVPEMELLKVSSEDAFKIAKIKAKGLKFKSSPYSVTELESLEITGYEEGDLTSEKITAELNRRFNILKAAVVLSGARTANFSFDKVEIAMAGSKLSLYIDSNAFGLEGEILMENEEDFIKRFLWYSADSAGALSASPMDLSSALHEEAKVLKYKFKYTDRGFLKKALETGNLEDFSLTSFMLLAITTTPVICPYGFLPVWGSDDEDGFRDAFEKFMQAPDVLYINYYRPHNSCLASGPLSALSAGRQDGASLAFDFEGALKEFNIGFDENTDLYWEEESYHVDEMPD